MEYRGIVPIVDIKETDQGIVLVGRVGNDPWNEMSWEGKTIEDFTQKFREVVNEYLREEDRLNTLYGPEPMSREVDGVVFLDIGDGIELYQKDEPVLNGYNPMYLNPVTAERLSRVLRRYVITGSIYREGI